MRGEYALVGFSKLFGYYPVAWEPGKFEIHWNATDAFTTGQIPVIHGGALAALLDNVMGWATLAYWTTPRTSRLQTCRYSLCVERAPGS
jgi:acyl-coenzyme A thioesterase PaaI-like protein